MINAYIEIIIMLLGAFFLGLFVAWQYWRNKFRNLQHSHDKLRKESATTITEKGQKITELEKAIGKLEEGLTVKRQELEKKEEELIQSKDQSATLGREVEILDRELVAAHDELYSITKTTKKSSYYKYIDGKRYKAVTLKEAELATEGKGDGRISMEDARKIFGTISDGKKYTPVEKATIRYIRENYNWTEQADQLFRHLVGSWAAHDHNVDEIQE